MNPAFQLSRLQKIDSEIDQITSRQNEIHRIIEDDSDVKMVIARLTKADKVLTDLHKQLEEIEYKNQQIQIKLQESEHALYGGKIRLPRELQDLQNEIASLKKQIATHEEQQFELMMQIDESEKDRAGIQIELNAVQSTFATRVALAKGEHTSLEKKKENLITEKMAAVQNLAPDAIQTYERLRKSKRGLAVSLVIEQACVACGSTLTPADWQAARSPQHLVFCSMCGRILYAG
jgi:predicted  nucleic acid-binding Zn-ribbon protein